METTKSIKMLRQRKLLLVLPLLALPFLTLIFWALGGGKGTLEEAGNVDKGFNHTLPDANLKEDDVLDKMNYYDKAAQDSAKRQGLEEKDPNFIPPSTVGTNSFSNRDTVPGYNPEESRRPASGYSNMNEERIHRKLAALHKAVNTPATSTSRYRSNRDSTTPNYPYRDTAEMERLEMMMQSMQQSDPQDPEMQQINGMLENILDIQHPERAQEKMRRASEQERGQVFTVSGSTPEAYLSSLEAGDKPQAFAITQTQNGFYSLDEMVPANTVQNAISAVIHETQTIVNGSTVKLRLTSDIFINGTKIEKDNFLFGLAALKGERLAIKITGLRYKNSLFPVDLSVYDLDGLEGIYMPGAISRDVAKASADRSAQSLGVTTLDDSWGAQAAGAGIEAAKSLFSKKVKLIKVVVKAGYQVLLYDEKQKQSKSN